MSFLKQLDVFNWFPDKPITFYYFKEEEIYDGDYLKSSGKLAFFPIADAIDEAPQQIKDILVKHFKQATAVKKIPVLAEFEKFERFMRFENEKKNEEKQQQRQLKLKREKAKDERDKEKQRKFYEAFNVEEKRKEEKIVRQEKIRRDIEQLEQEEKEAGSQSEKEELSQMHQENHRRKQEYLNAHRRDLRQAADTINDMKEISLYRRQLNRRAFGQCEDSKRNQKPSTKDQKHDTFAEAVQRDLPKSHSRHGDNIASGKSDNHRKHQDQQNSKQPKHKSFPDIELPSPEKPKRREKTVEEIAEDIQSIDLEVEKAIVEVENFQGNQQNKEYFILDENLTQQMLKLDAVSLLGNPDLKLKRREVIKKVKKALEMLEGKLHQPDDTNEKVDQNSNEFNEDRDLIDFGLENKQINKKTDKKSKSEDIILDSNVFKADIMKKDSQTSKTAEMHNSNETLSSGTDKLNDKFNAYKKSKSNSAATKFEELKEDQFSHSRVKHSSSRRPSREEASSNLKVGELSRPEKMETDFDLSKQSNVDKTAHMDKDHNVTRRYRTEFTTQFNEMYNTTERKFPKHRESISCDGDEKMEVDEDDPVGKPYDPSDYEDKSACHSQ